jgi:hypothetical protein
LCIRPLDPENGVVVVSCIDSWEKAHNRSPHFERTPKTAATVAIYTGFRHRKDSEMRLFFSFMLPIPITSRGIFVAGAES